MTIQYSNLRKEPMFGFAIAGGLIFLLYYALAEPEDAVIEISPVAVTDLVQMRTEIIGRPLADTEQLALIDEYVNQEILLREAVARGLHLNDPRVRRRLTDKMNFLLSEEPPEPNEADLKSLYAADPSRYRTRRTTSFEHVFFKSDKAAAEAFMGRLRAGEEPAPDVGDRFWLGRQMSRYSASQLLTLLGYKFERELRSLPIGEWRGPIRSGRGWHLVRVQARHEPHDLPEQERLRRLRADWDARHREQSRDRRLAELRAHYEVVLPETALGGAAQ